MLRGFPTNRLLETNKKARVVVMNNNIFIPQKIRVGFRERDDTYTKKLAYIIYYDEKGKLRKEVSWENWRDEKIEPIEYDNTPLEGFVLNKKVGGYAGYYGSFRQAYVRVYDPRGFEFEITIPNLLFILEHTSSIKGKGLEGEFVYGWDSTDLVLIPTCSPDYIQLSEFNKKRFNSTTIKAKDLKIGATYLTKGNERWVYMGRFDSYTQGYLFDGRWFLGPRQMRNYATKHHLPIDKWHEDGYRGFGHRTPNYTIGWGTAGKEYFFCCKEHCNGLNNSNGVIRRKSMSDLLVDTISEEPVTNYAELFEELERYPGYSPPDPTKDVFRLCTPEECAEHFRDSGHGYCYSTIFNGEQCRVELIPEKYCQLHTNYTASFVNGENGRYTSGLEGLFQFKEIPSLHSYTLPRTEMIPIPLEEIIKALPPYCTDKYLQNGKFYQRVF